METRVEIWRRDTLLPLALDLGSAVSVLGQWNVDEGDVHVDVRVLLVLLLQALCLSAEPLNLAGLDPVVSLVSLLVWRV